MRETSAGNTGEYKREQNLSQFFCNCFEDLTFEPLSSKNESRTARKKRRKTRTYISSRTSTSSLFLSFVSKPFFRNFNTTFSVHRCLLFLDERQEQLVFVTGDKRDNEQVKLKEQQIIINFYLIVHLLLLTLILHQTKLYYLCDPLHSHLFVTQGIIVFVFHFQF